MEDEEDEDYDDDYAGQFDWLHDHDYDNDFYWNGMFDLAFIFIEVLSL